MSFKMISRLTPLCVLLAAGTALVAQSSTGAVVGKVVDAAGKPLRGVRVAFESPALFQPRILTSDANGEYRAQLLPVGTYTIKASVDGFVGQTAHNFRIGLGSNLALNFTLRPVQAASTVVDVVASSAQEAKTADKTSINFSAQQLLQLPTTSSFDGAMALAPGVTGSGLSANIRGGSIGSDSKGSVGYSQVLYRVDGIDVRDDSGSQLDQTNKATLYEPLPDSIEDVEVVLAALNARYGRTQGGQVNVLTRTGSNEFAGSMRAFFNRASWTTQLSKGPVAQDVMASEANAREAFSRYTDITFSGPIIKDRLWFYFGTRIQPKDAGTNRMGWGGRVVDPSGAEIPGLTVPDVLKYPMTTLGMYPGLDEVMKNGGLHPAGYRFFNLATDSSYGQYVPRDTQYQKYEGKLTAMLNANHTLSMTFLHDQAETTGMSGERSNAEFSIFKEFLGTQVDKTRGLTLAWTGNFADKWFLEARASDMEYRQNDVVGPTTHPTSLQAYLATGDENIRIAQDWGKDQTSGYYTTYYGPIYSKRASASLSPNIRGNRSLNVNAKTFLGEKGEHELDFGAEQYETRHQYGRERSGNRQVWSGGFIYNPTLKDFLYPTFHTTDQSSHNIGTNGWADNWQVHWWDAPMRSPGAHMEKFWSSAAASKNTSNALWVNDIWSINSKWNLLAGLRWNKHTLYDTDGSEQLSLSLVEPRFQVKFNPDGNGTEVYAFSAAKLASAYTDEMASNFRANGWNVRTVHSWNGLPGQPAVDDIANGHATDPLGLYGLRWVPYNVLVDPANYGAAVDIHDNRKSYDYKGLKTPYAMEMTFGYARNYSTGYVRMNLVHRTYKQEVLSYVHDGYGYQNGRNFMTLLSDPGGSDFQIWKPTQRFINSSQDKIYQSVELSWLEQLSPKLTFGGNYTYSQLTGRDPYEYHDFRYDKLQLGMKNNEFAPEGLLSRDQVAHVFLTYAQPVGKGNVSASVLANYWTANRTSVRGVNNLPQPWPDDPALGGHKVVAVEYPAIARMPVYSMYYSPLGAFKSGADVYQVNLKLQAQIPLARKLMLTATLQVDNLFNHIQQHRSVDWFGDVDRGWGYDWQVPGMPLATFNKPWGYAGDATYHAAGRTVTHFSVGLKF